MTQIVQNPEIGKFLEQWKRRYENRTFNFDRPADQADFFEALTEIGLHITHCAQRASVSSVVDEHGLNTVYLRVTPKP